MVLSAILSFAIALLVTGVAVYIGASIFVDVQDYSLAVGTSLIAVIAMWVTMLLFSAFGAVLGAIPLIGGLLALPFVILALPVVLAVVLTVFNIAYPGGYVEAAGVSGIAVLLLLIVQLLLPLPTLFV